VKRISGNIALVFIFLFSFGIFLYLSFPYGVLKEALSSKIQSATGVTIRIEDLGPAFPFGFKATGVEVLGASGSNLNFSKVSATLSIFQLFLMRLGINLDIEAGSKGLLSLSLGFPILKLLTSSGSVLPSHVEFEATKFPVDGIVSYGLKTLADSGAAGSMAGPLVAALGFRGAIDGEVSLKLDSANLGMSNGKAQLKFTNAALVLSDASIGLPDQVFKSAQIQMELVNGAVKIAPSSRFTADELELGVDGKMNLKPTITASDLDLKVLVKLAGSLQDKFGWVMDGISGGASKGGQLNLQIRGTVGNPVTAGM
jgi:type II secretion system protein N